MRSEQELNNVSANLPVSQSFIPQPPVTSSVPEYYDRRRGVQIVSNQDYSRNMLQSDIMNHQQPESFVPGGIQQSTIRSLQPETSSGAIDIRCNDVDSWIDELDPNMVIRTHMLTAGIPPETLMAWMIQQYLPKVHLPNFDGSAADWVDFIVKFKEVVHNQPYLADGQKNQLLLTQLRGEAKRAVKGYANDGRGYVMALQTLKHLFGQRPVVAKAALSRVMNRKTIGDNDVRGLSVFVTASMSVW